MRRHSLVLAIGPGSDVSGPPPPVLLPMVDGVSLVDLIGAYEGKRRWSPAGGYIGLDPRANGHDVEAYYLGRASGEGAGNGRAWVLGCVCGYSGCWPLDARIDVATDTVTWDDFVQPFRPDQNYSGFGPLVFPRPAYERAVRDALRLISERGT